MYLGDLYTVTTNLAGVAGLSLPCGFSASGLPIGLQLQSRAFDEDRLLRAGHMFQTGDRLASAEPGPVERSHPASLNIEVIIGLEVHVQLATETKLFCGCSTRVWRSAEYASTCPVCLGLPGACR